MADRPPWSWGTRRTRGLSGRLGAMAGRELAPKPRQRPITLTYRGLWGWGSKSKVLGLLWRTRWLSERGGCRAEGMGGVRRWGRAVSGQRTPIAPLAISNTSHSPNWACCSCRQLVPIKQKYNNKAPDRSVLQSVSQSVIHSFIQSFSQWVRRAVKWAPLTEFVMVIIISVSRRLILHILTYILL